MKNTMSTNRLTVMAMTMVSSLLFFTGCEKENENTTLPEGAMKISTEASQVNDGTKTTVSDLIVNWVEGDMVKVNNGEYPVTISDGIPYLLNIDNSVDMYACFPSTNNSISGNIATINYPASYEYETVGGVQKLDLPMVAHANQGTNELQFKHANSTIEVRVKNNFGVTYMLDSITIISSGCALSGTGTVNTETPATFQAPDPTDANKKVVMTFGSGLSINNDDIKKVQIPVFPGGSTSITVRIAGRPANIVLNNGKVDAAVRFVYVNSATVNLERAKVLAAPCTMKIDNLAMKKLYPTFSVSSTQKVHFSKGNLQYIASSDEWQFAGSQTETIGTANDNISSNNSPIDLFGWGTGSNPTNISTNNADYATFEDWGNRTLYGSSQWRTLAYTEWQYLLGSRGGNMYVKAAIAGKEGVIIFPDNYTPSYSFVSINVKTIEYTTNSISIATWRDLEADGCIFLPTTGMRDGTTGSSWSNAAYWSATPNGGGDKALRVLAGRGLFYYGNSSNEDNKFRGMAVRLVQNVD